MFCPGERCGTVFRVVSLASHACVLHVRLCADHGVPAGLLCGPFRSCLPRCARRLARPRSRPRRRCGWRRRLAACHHGLGDGSLTLADAMLLLGTQDGATPRRNRSATSWKRFGGQAWCCCSISEFELGNIPSPPPTGRGALASSSLLSTPSRLGNDCERLLENSGIISIPNGGCRFWVPSQVTEDS